MRMTEVTFGCAEVRLARRFSQSKAAALSLLRWLDISEPDQRTRHIYGACCANYFS